MKELEIKVALKSAIKNFEEKYPEWADYTLAPKKDNLSVEVISGEDKLDIQAAKEMLRDFAVELKQKNLMVVSQHQGDFTVGEYVYTFEEGLEDLADELEFKLGNYFSNLSVSVHKNKPYVRFVYIGSLTSKDKEKVLDQIKTITEQYKPVDPDDIFSDIEFEELDEVLEEIKGKDFDDMAETYLEEPKAKDEMHYADDGTEIVDGIEFEMHDYHFEKYPSAVKAVKRAAIIYFTQQNDFDGNDIKKVLCHDTYLDLESKNESKIKSGSYKLAMIKKIAQKNDGKSTVEYDYELVPLQKAEAEYKQKGEDVYEAVDGLSEGLSCEYIAEMHDVDLDFIMEQLEKGIKVEMEHTDDPEIAKAIAKDHLVEIPDYYDRLEQMEEQAEAEPMLSDGTEDKDDKFMIDSSEEMDEEGAMARVQLQKIVKNAKELLEILEDESQLPAWIQSKLTLADHHLEASANYLLYEDEAKDKEKEDFYAEDDHEVKENIPVTSKNDELIWKAERDLIEAINEGNFKKAQSLFDFIYNFDILTAAETMGQFEDLWNRRDKYQEEIYELSLYEMFDKYNN